MFWLLRSHSEICGSATFHRGALSIQCSLFINILVQFYQIWGKKQTDIQYSMRTHIKTATHTMLDACNQILKCDVFLEWAPTGPIFGPQAALKLKPVKLSPKTPHTNVHSHINRFPLFYTYPKPPTKTLAKPRPLHSPCSLCCHFDRLQTCFIFHCSHPSASSFGCVSWSSCFCLPSLTTLLLLLSWTYTKTSITFIACFFVVVFL